MVAQGSLNTREHKVHAIGGRPRLPTQLATACGYSGNGSRNKPGLYYDEARAVPFRVTDDDQAVTCQQCKSMLTTGRMCLTKVG